MTMRQKLRKRALKYSNAFSVMPYKGLDFYHEQDAVLFPERHTEIRECARLLLGFGVKFLLLQGSSGSGKSSFLRAGLIPALKSHGTDNDQSDRNRCFFLAGVYTVIRCTSDPLRELSNAILTAIRQPEAFDAAPLNVGEEAITVPTRVRRQTRTALVTASRVSPTALASALAETLAVLANFVPGKLIIALDQAEEVLTRTTGRQESPGPSTEFFRFLEEIYVRNIDVKIVIVLRTEYYGQFRDEFRISDDRLSSRPRSGGLEPFLLRPLRDPVVLERIIASPTQLRGWAGERMFSFSFAPGLVTAIVNDLLAQFPHAAVTPALQVVCAKLYSTLDGGTGEITNKTYSDQGKLTGIIRSYVDDGISVVSKRTGDGDKWRFVLHSLVSRQGGGTLVSLTESTEVIQARARSEGITGDVSIALTALSMPPNPLLRGEPDNEPLRYSLKHDALAVVLSRWQDEHAGAQRTATIWRRMMAAVVTGSVVVGTIIGFLAYQRGQLAAEAKERTISITEGYSKRSPRGNFRQSLLLTLTNIHANERYIKPFVSGWGVFSSSDSFLEPRLIAGLKDLLLRSPRMVHRAIAAGVDPQGKRVAILHSQSVEVISLENLFASSPIETTIYQRYALPRITVTRGFGPIVGFLDGLGLGPVVYDGSGIYFWEEPDKPQYRELWTRLPLALRKDGWLFVEFASGRLRLLRMARDEQQRSITDYVLELLGSELALDIFTIDESRLQFLSQRPSSTRRPVLSEFLDDATQFAHAYVMEPRSGTIEAGIRKDPRLSEKTM